MPLDTCYMYHTAVCVCAWACFMNRHYCGAQVEPNQHDSGQPCLVPELALNG